MGRNKKIFETPEQKFAVTANDEEIWPRLTCCNKAVEISSYKKTSEPWLDIRVISEPYHPNYTRRPQQLPFTLKDLQDFVSNGLPPPWKRFSVRWASKSNKSTDTTYGDGFRAVFIFRTIEFMIRPVEEGVGPGRLHFTVTDVAHCLRAALSQSLGDEMRTVIGTASAADPEEVRGSPKPRVVLEWRIDRADEDKVSREVSAWRKHQCHPTDNGVYKVLKKAYDKQIKEEKKKQKDQSARDPVEIEPEPVPAAYIPSSQPGQGMPPREKRRHDKSSSPGPDQKRRTMGSQSGTFSSSQPVTSSQELPRSSTVASSGSKYQQQPRLPGPSAMVSGAPAGAGPSSGPPYGQPPISSAGASTRFASSQPTITGVTQGMSGMSITAPAPGGYGGQNPLPPPTNYGPRPVPVQMRHPRPSQYEGYATPQPPPSQGYPPQGTSGGQYDTPPYYQGNTGGNPQGRGYPTQPPYQGAPAGSQSGRGGSSRDDPRGRGHSGSKHSHHHKGGSSRR